MRFPLFIFCIVAVLTACTREKKPGQSNMAGEVKIDGSSTVYPITEAVAEEFREPFPDVKVTAGLSGTGGGFKKFGRGEIDINDASRRIKDSEAEICRKNNIKFLELEVAYDGLTIVVNPENNWVNEITVAELKKIWEPEAQGVIKNWNQIRPEWPDQEIHLFGAGVESGTYDYFTEAIVGKSHSSRGDYTASEDDNVLVQGIASDKYALGFFGFAYYDENRSMLKAIPVNNGNGPVSPSIKTVMDKSYAPLSRSLFIYVSDLAVKRPEVVEFVNFYLKHAGELSEAVGYIALRPEEYQQQNMKFQNFLGGKDSTSTSHDTIK